MTTKHKFFSIFFIPILAFAIIGGCGGGGSDDGGGPTSNEMIVVEGTIADVVANANSTNDSFFLARIFNYIKPTINAIAQEETMDELSGIMVTASDGVDTFGPVVTDANGNFSIEVPCETPLTFTFTTEDSQSASFGEIQFPCPMDGTMNTTVLLTVTLDLNDEGGMDIEVEEEDMPEAAVINCSGEDELEIIQDELVVEGNSGPCIISTGECEIYIESSNVFLTGCSTCIDTRGESSVEIKTGHFVCEAVDKGIRAVGSSEVEVEVKIDDMMDGTMMPSSTPTQIVEESDLLIDAGIIGVDTRGNSSVELEANIEDDMMEVMMMDGTMMGSNNTTLISILAGETSVAAVGNSEIEAEADECIIDPDVNPSNIKGNAEVEIECDGTEIEIESEIDEDSDSGAEVIEEDSDSGI